MSSNLFPCTQLEHWGSRVPELLSPGPFRQRDASVIGASKETSFQGAASCVQQVLDSVGRQEVAAQQFAEQHSMLCGLVRMQHEMLCGKFNELSCHLGLAASSKDAHLQAPEVTHPQTQDAFESDRLEESKDEAAGASAGNEVVEDSHFEKHKLHDHSATLNLYDSEGAKVIKAHKEQKRKSKNESQAGAQEAQLLVEAGHWAIVTMRTSMLNHNFDIISGIVILVNMCVMIVHLQWKGYDHAYDLSIRSDDAGWSIAKSGFEKAEVVFNLVYLIELMVRICVLQGKFFKNAFNIIDTVIVLVSCIDILILQPFTETRNKTNLAALRLMRFFRIFHLHRAMHSTEHFCEIRVLIKALVVSMRGLIWSSMLIGGIILAGAVVVVQLCHSFLIDETISLARRQWIYLSFGTTARAVYSMFVCTFTGTWPGYVKPFVDEVHVGMLLFFVPYIVCINFAVMRVIAALLLKQTLAVAATDDNRLAKLKEKEQEVFAGELRKLFSEADTSGDGNISKSEFREMLQNSEVLMILDRLDIGIEEAIALFGVLCAGDGEADYEEFVDGAYRLKGGARTVDTMQIMHQLLQTHKFVVAHSQSLEAHRQEMQTSQKGSAKKR